MKRISDWAKVLLPLVGSGMVLHYLFLWHERRHAVALHKEVYHNAIQTQTPLICGTHGRSHVLHDDPRCLGR